MGKHSWSQKKDQPGLEERLFAQDCLKWLLNLQPRKSLFFMALGPFRKTTSGPLHVLCAPREITPPFLSWGGTCPACLVSAFRRLIFSLSLAVPQFKLLSRVSSLRLPSGHSGPVLTLSNAARSPFSPHLLVADAGVWGTFLLGVAFRHAICEFYLFFLPVRLPSEIRKLPPDPPERGFPGVWKLLPLRLPSQDGSPSLALLSLFLSFIFCPTSFRRQWSAFLGAWFFC